MMPFVAYGMFRTLSKFSKSFRYTSIIIFGYLLFSLCATSTPTREFLSGVEESFSKTELKAASTIFASVLSNYTIDTDVRFGDLLLFYSGGRMGNIGNRMYFQNLSANWVITVSQGGGVDPAQGQEVVIITESMLREEQGVVVSPAYLPLKPLTISDVMTLGNREEVNRVLDFGDVVVFITNEGRN
jgi:hypothetical protein